MQASQQIARGRLTLRAPNWAQLNLPGFRKDFYVEHPDIARLTGGQVNAWRKKHEMTIKGSDIPKPMQTFAHGGFPDYIMEPIREAGFAAPTAIQSQGWPMALSGRDVIGIAKTGSGKTLAFLLPGMLHIMDQAERKPGEGPIMLVMAPTRELARQIKEECDIFSKASRLKKCVVYGGAPKPGQKRQLEAGVDIIIATPGRLIDFMSEGVTNLLRVTYLVLDEADRMLDMGFLPQIRNVVSQIRPDKQTMLFSATFPKSIQQIARDFMRKDPIQVTIGNHDITGNKDITQIVSMPPITYGRREKTERLVRILQEQEGAKILVFIATKRHCNKLSKQLSKTYGVNAQAIHGDRSQSQRERALEQFKTGQVQVLCATDVASRGLHVDDIDIVVNYDLPQPRCMEDYVHRIGRTARAGKKGTSYAFIDGQRDAGCVKFLVNVLQRTGQAIPAPLATYAKTGSWPKDMAADLPPPPPQKRQKRASEGQKRQQSQGASFAVGQEVWAQWKSGQDFKGVVAGAAGDGRGHSLPIVRLERPPRKWNNTSFVWGCDIRARGPVLPVITARGDLLFKELALLDPADSARESYCVDGKWDVDGLNEDLETARATACLERSAGQRLFQALQKADGEAQRDDYFVEGAWDIEGVLEDLRIQWRKAPAPATPKPAPGPVVDATSLPKIVELNGVKYMVVPKGAAQG